MKRMIVFLAALAAALSIELASAQRGGPPDFAGMDANSDGALTAEELASFPPVQNGNVSAEQLLGAWDSDGNGSVSQDEFNNRPQGMGRGGMGMGMGMGG